MCKLPIYLFLITLAFAGQQFPLWLSKKAILLSADNFPLSADFLPGGFQGKFQDK